MLGRPVTHRRRSSLCCLAVGLVLLLGIAATARAGDVAASNTRLQVLRIAEREIGYTEPGDFCTAFGPCELWCSWFVTWVWRQAGVPVPALGFVGAVWQWAHVNTAVISGSGTPEPGDAVLYGTGPQNVTTAPHIGLVEAVYPRYLVTIEGDVVHGVRRFVVPRKDPESTGEPGPIWAYASPVPLTDQADVRDPDITSPFTSTIVHETAPLDRRHRLVLRAIRALRAFQHMPYRSADYRVDWTGVDSQGRVDVRVTTAEPMTAAQLDWRRFLHRFDDSGRAYVVTFDAPPNPPKDIARPSIAGVPSQGQILIETHGRWSNEPTHYAYRWLRCDTSGQACLSIAGATAESYTLRAADISHTVRVDETADNDGGSGPSAVSTPTAIISAAGSTPPPYDLSP